MKFRDPKTEEVFEVERDKCSTRFCIGVSCIDCPIMEKADGLCSDWVNSNPAEAARLMGYEVEEDQEEPMENTDKPRICEVLVVEETPVSKAMEVVIDALQEDKTPGSWYYSWQSNIACTIMDNADVAPDTANKIAIKFLDRLCERKPCFTEEEVADARSITRLIDGSTAAKIERAETGVLRLMIPLSVIGKKVVDLDCTLFPSLRPGQAVRLEDVK